MQEEFLGGFRVAKKLFVHGKLYWRLGGDFQFNIFSDGLKLPQVCTGYWPKFPLLSCDFWES